jgi:hypothetical protein
MHNSTRKHDGDEHRNQWTLLVTYIARDADKELWAPAPYAEQYKETQ